METGFNASSRSAIGASVHILSPKPFGAGIALRIANMALVEKTFGFRAARDLVERISKLLADQYGCGPDIETDYGVLSCYLPSVDLADIVSPNLSREEALAQAITAIIVAGSIGEGGELPMPVVQVVATMAGDSAPLLGTKNGLVALARKALGQLNRQDDLADNAPGREHYRQQMFDASRYLSALLDRPSHENASPVCRSGDGVELYKSLSVAGLDDANCIASLESEYRSVAAIGMARPVDEMRVNRVIDFLKDNPLVSVGLQISPESAVIDHWWRNILLRLKDNRGVAQRLYLEILPPFETFSHLGLSDFCREVRALKVQIVLDQFGAGGSALRDVMVLQPDYVKIETAFLWRAQDGLNAFQTLRHLIGLTHSLKAPAIITGVDTPKHAQIAADAGAVWMTGAHFGSGRVAFECVDENHLQRTTENA